MRFVLIALLVVLGSAPSAMTRNAATPNIDRFLMTDHDAEIALARSAAPAAHLTGSPVIAIADPAEHLTQFVIPTQRWSDGTVYLRSSPHSGITLGPGQYRER